tara:strand:- start:206 stop:874 length:669 start_codon:yes stop_codon:yes gene_type:complete
MKKSLLLLISIIILSCSKKENKCEDSELGVNCPDATYINETNSPYVLPWEIGKTFTISQSNCTDGSHFKGGYNQFAYDVNMPIGTPIVAIRSGIVIEVIENFIDLEPGINDYALVDQANLIKIEHEDGTIADYTHLTLNGALKDLGDNVVQGEKIALSGNTGYTSGPHLHFQVSQCEDTDPRPNYTWIECESIPITFKNTKEHCQGLLERNLMPDGYTAEKY